MHDFANKAATELTRHYPPQLRRRGPTSRRLIAAIAACAASVAPLDAAEIREGFKLGEAVLEGKIEAGDFDRLRSFVDENLARSIYLASPGGNLAEAIEIGRFVRALKLETIIPVRVRGDLREKLAERHKLTNPSQLCVRQRVFLRVCCWRQEGP